MRNVPDLFRDGLADWVRALLTGDDATDEGEAAGSLLAETLIRHRLWIEAQSKKG
jgi:sugar (pentulose or hexulose) kinase